MARGNHEVCGRAGKGWFIFLDTTLATPPTDLCIDFSSPFSVNIGEVDIFNMDTACAEDSDAPSDLVDQYASEFETLGNVQTSTAWLLTHHPMWGIDDEKKSPTASNPIWMITPMRIFSIPLPTESESGVRYGAT